MNTSFINLRQNTNFQSIPQRKLDNTSSFRKSFKSHTKRILQPSLLAPGEKPEMFNGNIYQMNLNTKFLLISKKQISIEYISNRKLNICKIYQNWI